MEEVLLDNIKFKIDFESLLDKINIESGSEKANKVKEIATEAMEVGKPKALYQVAYIDEENEDSVVIEGIKFTSRILRVNLDSAQRVFPFVATCGTELEEWSTQYEGDLLESYWVDVIKEIALNSARDTLKEHINKYNNPGSISKMNPGSLDDWPMNEQEKLFKLLGSATEEIGVNLTNSFLMQPVKSTSGIWFPTETSFENCQLCPRTDCPSRKAPYDEELYEKRYQKDES